MKKGIHNILPDYRFPTITAIDRSLLARHAVILFDVDNTLVFPETVESTEAISAWFRTLPERPRRVCLSNSRTWERRRPAIAEIFSCETFRGTVRKPRKRLFHEIRTQFNVDANQILVVGDRIISDVLFGNRNGATTILVPPLTHKEAPLIRIARFFEQAAARFIALPPSSR